MDKRIKKVETGGHRLLCIAYPPDILPDLPDSDWDIFKAQEFVWYKDFVAFRTRADNGSYLVEIFVSDEVSALDETDRAILVPFSVPPEGILLVTGSYDECYPFRLKPGNYKMLLETRFLTDEEIEASDHYDYLVEEIKNPNIEFWDTRRPELCTFTFVKTDKEIEPVILKGSKPKQALILHNRHRPPGYE